MLPDRVSNPGPLTYESGALPIALRGPALTVKYHQNSPKGFLVIVQTRNGRTDGRQAHRYIPRTFQSEDKKRNYSRIIIKMYPYLELTIVNCE